MDLWLKVMIASAIILAYSFTMTTLMVKANKTTGALFAAIYMISLHVLVMSSVIFVWHL